MKLRPSEPGLYISAALHGALLLAALISFSDTKKFTDGAEAIPVDMITESQFNEVTKGAREAPLAEAPKPVVDRVAEVEESKPQPVTRETKVDVPAPPPPQREPDPTPPEPPPRVAQPEPPPPAPTPPPRPPEPPKAEPPPKPEPPKPQSAEAIEPPKPPPRPRDLPKVEPPKPEPPKPQPKPQLDRAQIAALLEKQKKEEEAKKPPRPPAGREPTEQRRFDPNSISQLLSKEEAGQRASTGRTQNQTPSMGNPNATGQKMSPSMLGQLDGLMIEQYKRCWNYLPLGPTSRYVPLIEVSYRTDGSLAREPRLRNPPNDPNLRALADSAMRAVKQCNPLRIPAVFIPYFDEWKNRLLRFDPDEMSG